MTDTIHIDNLSMRGKHGVSDNERNVEQEFLVTIKLATDTRWATESDMLSDTIDYSKVRAMAQNIIEGESCYLIERLAEKIALELLMNERVMSAEVTIKKPSVWKSGVPGVTIVRKKTR